jgi:predicted PurR-regulated permease PerM
MDNSRSGVVLLSRRVRSLRISQITNRLLIAFLASLALSGCSAIQGLAKSALKTNEGIVAQVGKNNEANTIKAELTNESKQTTDITSESVQIFNNEVSLVFLLLLILGWMLPSPSELWRSLKGLLKNVRGNRISSSNTGISQLDDS